MGLIAVEFKDPLGGHLNTDILAHSRRDAAGDVRSLCPSCRRWREGSAGTWGLVQIILMPFQLVSLPSRMPAIAQAHAALAAAARGGVSGNWTGLLETASPEELLEFSALSRALGIPLPR